MTKVTRSFGEFDALIEKTLDHSFLSEASRHTRDQLLATATLVDYAAGAEIYRPYGPGGVAIILSGLVRSYLTSATGRQMSLRYGVPGDLFGLPSLVGGPMPGAVDAVQNSQVLFLEYETLERLVRADGATGWRLAEELGGDFCDLMITLAENVFDSVPIRLARHLLALSLADPANREPFVRLTQKELAQAEGSVREVVTRTLKKFQTDGLIHQQAGKIVLLDVVGLKELCRPTK